MSKEAISAFFKEVASDPDLQKKLVKLAAEHGYRFTSDELAEADLATLTGGVMTIIPPIAKPGKK